MLNTKEAGVDIVSNESSYGFSRERRGERMAAKVQ